MKTIENKTLYVCDFCKKKLFIKSAMEKHEKFCSMNPTNYKACSGCLHLEEIQYEIDLGDDYYNNPITRLVKTFNCKLLNQKMYPTKVERLDLINKYPYQFSDQAPMPKECDKKKFIF